MLKKFERTGTATRAPGPHADDPRGCGDGAQGGVTMAHSKCLTCRARVWRDRAAADHLDDLCPGCGGPLEIVVDLSELVGLRSLRARPRPAHRRSPDLSARISAQICKTIARNDAERQRRIDAERA
jgi:hypothetical protein